MTKEIYPMVKNLAEEGTFAGPVAFSNGVKVTATKLLFISGQLAFDENMNLVGKGDMRAQTRQVLENIKKVLEGASATFKDVVRVTVYIRDMSKFRDIHDVRLEYFDKDHLPASTMVEVNRFVHEDALIEIDAIAVV
jgi:reactive intermediate/imine deaminase